MNSISRRSFLRVGGAVGTLGLAGCTMTKGAIDPAMGAVMGVEGLAMFKGAPEMDKFPAQPETLEMGEGMSVNAVVTNMVAADDDSDNYHFMPHVSWIEPGTTVLWKHVDIEGTSEPRTHTVTAFGTGGKFPRFIPDGADGFDSGFLPGLHGVNKKEGIDDRFNRRIADRVGIGPFMHTFEQQGVYLYNCQNHHQFKMAGAVVVGELWGENGDETVDDPAGWSPAMTRNSNVIPRVDRIHGDPLKDQVDELREMIRSGGEMGMEM